MSKFCNNCGSVMEDDVVFCPNCGAQDQPAEAPAAGKKLNLNPKTLILGAVAVVVALLLVLVLFGNGPKNALNRYEKVMNGKGNIEKLYPKDYYDYRKDQDEDFTKSSFLENIEDSVKAAIKSREEKYGDNAKISFTLIEKKKVSKDDREKAAEQLEKAYDFDEKKVSQVVRMAVRVDIKGKDEKTFYYDELIAYKYKGVWYLDLEGDTGL